MPCPSQFTLCHEKWSDMTPTESGRLCATCDRELIDFTGMSETEIRAYHLRKPGTCGLYSLSQFHKSGSRLAAAAAAAAIGLIPPTAAHAVQQDPATGATHAVVQPADSILVAGTVVDSATDQPMRQALVTVAGTLYATQTDHDGHFRFHVRSPVTMPMRIQALSIGYRTRDTHVTSMDSLANLHVTMSQTFVGIDAFIVAEKPRALAPKAKPSFWRRLWRALGGN